MNSKITLKPRTVFEAFAGEKSLGEYTLTSEWNGLAQLKGKAGELIVIRPNPVSRTLAAIIDDNPSEEVTVVKASPDIIAAIMESNKTDEQRRE